MVRIPAACGSGLGFNCFEVEAQEMGLKPLGFRVSENKGFIMVLLSGVPIILKTQIFKTTMLTTSA